MDRIFNWYYGLSKQLRDSIIISATIVGAISTVLSILGVSLGDLETLNIWVRICIVIAAFVLLAVIVYFILEKIFKSQVKLIIRQTPVCVGCGDIFNAPGMRVIGCDTHFDTRIDDVIIAKKSLHGQLFLEYGNIDEIKDVIKAEARRLGLRKNSDGFYEFPLGTIIRYDSRR